LKEAGKLKETIALQNDKSIMKCSLPEDTQKSRPWRIRLRDLRGANIVIVTVKRGYRMVFKPRSRSRERDAQYSTDGIDFRDDHPAASR
jgi:hypothetical protein